MVLCGRSKCHPSCTPKSGKPDRSRRIRPAPTRCQNRTTGGSERLYRFRDKRRFAPWAARSFTRSPAGRRFSAGHFLTHGRGSSPMDSSVAGHREFERTDVLSSALPNAASAKSAGNRKISVSFCRSTPPASVFRRHPFVPTGELFAGDHSQCTSANGNQLRVYRSGWRLNGRQRRNSTALRNRTGKEGRRSRAGSNRHAPEFLDVKARNSGSQPPAGFSSQTSPRGMGE